MVFQAQGVTKRFGRRAVLRGLDLSLNPGECVVLFGRNGAGKTTFLQIVATLLRASEGVTTYWGQSVEEAAERIRARIGLVSHASYLYPELSVEENLRFFARLYGVEPRIDEVLREASLTDRRSSVVAKLSRGMQQRLSLARATLHQPELLLLDEPFTGLDPVAAEILIEWLDRFVADGGTVLLTTHDVDRGVRVASRLVVLDEGRIRHTLKDSVDAVATRDWLQERLRGDAVFEAPR